MNLFENMQEPNRGAENRQLIGKWGKSGLLEGLKGEHEKATVSVLLENQARQLIKEGSANSGGAGTTGGSGFEQWSGVALPLIRRIFAEISAKEFVSVQPMNLPSGLVFYLDFKYGTNKQPFGFSPVGKNQTGTLQGITSQSGAPSDGLYGAGRFGYSVNNQAGTATAATNTTASLSVLDVYFDGNYSASVGTVTSTYKKVVYATSNLTNPDLAAIRSFRLFSGSSELTGSQILPAFTQLSGSNIIFAILGAAVSTGSFAANVSYSLAPTNDTRGDFEVATNRTADGTAQNFDTNLNIPEIELQMRSIPVTAKTRKLKAAWTPEFAQDLNAYHSIDAEAELTAMLSEYVSMEIDLEILDMLITSAATTDYWSAKVGQEYDSATRTFLPSQFLGQAYIQGT